MKILIVEDEEISARVLARAVVALGHESIVASDGLEALEVFAKQQPDAIITDWMMPNVDGPELCRRVRAAGASRYTYIIILTARGARSDKHEAISAGADDFLSKPLDKEELQSRLKVAERILEMQMNLEEKNAALERQQALLTEKNRLLERSQRNAEVAGSRFSQLFQNLPVPCFTFDSNLIVFEINEKLCSSFNKPIADLIQREITDLFGRDLVTEERVKELKKVLQGTPFLEQDWNDGERYYLVSAYPLYGHDRVVTGGIATAYDVTELRKMQAELRAANEALAAMAVTDGLTQIPNHRAFQDRLSTLISEAMRGRSFALAMLDVDHFKQFNDSFGHQAGDEVLISVAKTLKENTRKVDFAARYGGEEFAVIFLDVDAARAARLAEKLRRKISEIENPYRPITASFGVAMYGPTTPTEQSLIKAADDALYRAKDAGRNRVEFAGDDPAASAA